MHKKDFKIAEVIWDFESDPIPFPLQRAERRNARLKMLDSNLMLEDPMKDEKDTVRKIIYRKKLILKIIGLLSSGMRIISFYSSGLFVVRH